MPRVVGASSYSELFPGSDITDEEWAFMKAMAAYQKRWTRRYPSWREVLFVLHCLGYRKVTAAVPADSTPPTAAEAALGRAAKSEIRSAKSEKETATADAQHPDPDASPDRRSA